MVIYVMMIKNSIKIVKTNVINKITKTRKQVNKNLVLYDNLQVGFPALESNNRSL